MIPRERVFTIPVRQKTLCFQIAYSASSKISMFSTIWSLYIQPLDQIASDIHGAVYDGMG
jgi:hypothetical protein